MPSRASFVRIAVVGFAALLSCSCASVVIPGFGDAGSDTPVPPDAAPDAGSPTACVAATDCTWGEITHEIHSRVDCPCLFGCPTIALNVTTAARRTAQYRMFCVPNVDGQGHACGIDDCASPPPSACRMGICGPTM